MDFHWPRGDDRADHINDRILRRLEHSARRELRIEMLCVEILAVLKPAQVPVTVRIVTLEGAEMADITIAPGEVQRFTYTEQDASGNPIADRVGTASWSVPDPNVATVVDNGDQSVSVTGVNGGASSLDLSVTLADGTVLSDSDALTTSTPVAPPASVTIVPA